MDKKILLISPPRTGSWDSALFSVCEPLGLAYLAAVLELHDFKVEILDCFILGQGNKVPAGNFVRIGLGDDEIKDYIKKVKPDVVGISNMFTALASDSIQIARLVKEVDPDCLVVMGGAHATLEYNSILKSKDIDLVVLGEGEETFLEIVKRFSRNEDLTEIKGTALRAGASIKCNPKREPIKDLDRLPYPARHLLPMKLYFRDQSKTTFGLAMRFPVATMITSRGCPYNCIFCSTSKVWEKWRSREAKAVVDEIEVLVDSYGVKEIAFEDDNFVVDKKRVLDICNELLRRKINIKWTVPAGLSAWIIDQKTLLKMKEAGFYRVSFPIESGSKETLKFIRKPVDLKKVKQLVDFSNRIGLWTVGNFIFGFLDERPESIDQTIKYAQRSNLDMAIFYIAQPYAGSDLYSIYKERGLIENKAKEGSSLVSSLYDTTYFSGAELTDLRNKVSSQYLKKRVLFYCTPKGFFLSLLPKINSLEKIRYFFRMVKIIMPSLSFLKQ